MPKLTRRSRSPAAAHVPPVLEREPASGAAAEPGQYLTFRLAGGDYAVPVLRTREILQMPSLTRVPGTPGWIRGVMNLRGSVVPVVDLAVRLGLPRTAPGSRTCVVLVELDSLDEPTVMAILADAVSHVAEFRGEVLQDSPPFGTSVHPEYLKGLARGEGGGFTLILDLDRVLGAEELLVARAERGGGSAESVPADS